MSEYVIEIRRQISNLLSAGGSYKDKLNKHRELLETILKLTGFELIEGLQMYLRVIVNENVSLVISRQMINEIISHLTEFPDEISTAISHFILEKVQSRLVSFEEQATCIRHYMGDLYERKKLWRAAADALAGIPLESNYKKYSVDYKLEAYLRIVRLYLEVDEPVCAEPFLNRASLLQVQSQNEQMKCYYRACYARILDYRHKFIEAAQRYSILSTSENFSEEERLGSLQNAFICTVLASAGHKKSLMIATLMKDDRHQQLPAASILEKMSREKIIRRSEFQEFETLLRPHQTTIIANGMTIFDRAVIEYNLLAANKIYNNIKFTRLEDFLGSSPLNIEKVAAQMIREGRLRGYIDQSDSILYYESTGTLAEWDEQLQSVCSQLESIFGSVVADEPEWTDEAAEKEN